MLVSFFQVTYNFVFVAFYFLLKSFGDTKNLADCQWYVPTVLCMHDLIFILSLSLSLPLCMQVCVCECVHVRVCVIRPRRWYNSVCLYNWNDLNCKHALSSSQGFQCQFE